MFWEYVSTINSFKWLSRPNCERFNLPTKIRDVFKHGIYSSGCRMQQKHTNTALEKGMHCYNIVHYHQRPSKDEFCSLIFKRFIYIDWAGVSYLSVFFYSIHVHCMHNLHLTRNLHKPSWKSLWCWSHNCSKHYRLWNFAFGLGNW